MWVEFSVRLRKSGEAIEIAGDPYGTRTRVFAVRETGYRRPWTSVGINKINQLTVDCATPSDAIQLFLWTTF